MQESYTLIPYAISKFNRYVKRMRYMKWVMILWVIFDKTMNFHFSLSWNNSDI